MKTPALASVAALLIAPHALGTMVEPVKRLIDRRTKTMKGPFGENWQYAKVATLNVRVPVITSAGAILWNYVGQQRPPVQVKVSTPQYRKWLRAVLLAVQQLSTPSGVAQAKEEYGKVNVALNQSYYDKVGVSYPGTLWDYFEAYQNSSMDWLPSAVVLPSTKAGPKAIPLATFLGDTGLDNWKPRQRQLTSTEANTCQCGLPPPGCREGSTQVDILDCLEWSASSPIVPYTNLCESYGFKADYGDNVCANVHGDCNGPSDKYQEVFSLEGLNVYCCRCVSREPADPVAGSNACPVGWTTGYSDCYDLATGDCKKGGGLYSVTSSSGDPFCCECDYPSRRLSLWSTFWDVITAGCFSLFPGASEISTVADVADRAGARAVEAFMVALATQSCADRAEALAASLFHDAGCTQPYTDVNAIVLGCFMNPKCGTKGHPIKSSIPKPTTLPMTYYLKHEGQCYERRWNQNYAGTLMWCGGD